MASLSVLRSSDSKKKLIEYLIKNHAFVQKRYCNYRGYMHKRVMNIEPSMYQWFKFKNLASFYIMLGVIPLTIITVLANIFVGEAELAEIPDGYVPRHWEYYKHPVTRFFARYTTRDPRVNHEMTICRLNEESEKLIMTRIERDVLDVMRHQQDYASYFYRPVYGKYWRQNRADMKLWRDKYMGYMDTVTNEWGFKDYGDPNPPQAKE